MPPRTPTAAPPPTHKPAPKLAVPASVFAPPAIVLNAVEGWGKTSFAAFAPDAAILMARGEAGYTTLLGGGRVPAIPAAGIEEWPQLLAMLDDLARDPQGRKTLALDALGGFERLCHEYVCARDFGGEWGEKGFGSFQKGYEVAASEWLLLLQRLDALRQKHHMTVVILSHSKVKPFKNPLGADHDRYISDVHDKTWAPTAKWADCVLFGKFKTDVETKKDNKVESLKKGKGTGGTARIIYTEWRAGFDAKNRYGMPEWIDMPDDPSKTWATVWAAITQQTAPAAE